MAKPTLTGTAKARSVGGNAYAYGQIKPPKVNPLGNDSVDQYHAKQKLVRSPGSKWRYGMTGGRML